QSCQCPADKPIWEYGVCKCIADTDCQYSGTGFCCDDTEQVCRPCDETDCDKTKGLTLADGRCVCSGRKEWRQDEGDSEPSCKCPVNTPPEADSETCECPDGKDNVDEDGDGINECVTSCPSDTGFTGLRNRTTGNCLCNTGAGYKAESETVGGIQMCVCDETRDYYQGPSGCLQCVQHTKEWCYKTHNKGSTQDWLHIDIQCSSMDGTSWQCGNARKIVMEPEGGFTWRRYNPTTKSYCGAWQVLRKDSSGKFYCGTCDNFPVHRRQLAEEGRTDNYGYCTCRGYNYIYNHSTKKCERKIKCPEGGTYNSYLDKCVPCNRSSVYANGVCYNDAKYENCSLCYNGKKFGADGSRSYSWYLWYNNTPDYCKTPEDYPEPSLKSKAEDKCSYEYGCSTRNSTLASCEFNTKTTENCKCSTGGDVGEYCCSASTYPTLTGCSACPAGQVPNSSRTGCTMCEPNEITQNGKCVKCDKGYYPSSQQNRCLACPADRTTDEDGLTCSVCIDSNKIFNMITNTCECPP
ncbi:MAG: hypothetical protein IJO11_01680, partial [Alphaproteobacteria bacterium]|nr:hypothetical protein [Alphaproteobacteria bacterium]